MNSDRVILFHGLAMRPISMRPFERYLKRRGYLTCNIGYPSLKFPINTLVEQYIAPAVIEFCDKHKGPGKNHIVAQSLGGINAQVLLEKYGIPNLGKIVCWGPPKNGSEMADFFSRSTIAKMLLGPVLSELTTDSHSFVKQLGPIQHPEVGIIAGNRPIPFSSLIMPRPHDGLVSVKSATAEGAKVWVTNVNHASMMFNKPVWEQTVHFLQHGVFKDV